MIIKGGVTPKGTIFVRNFDESGRLLTKRVWKNHVQYDTLFNPRTKRYNQTLTTDWKSNKQFLQYAPQKWTWLKALKAKVLGQKEIALYKNSKGQTMQWFEPMDMDLFMNDKKGRFFVAQTQRATGFSSQPVHEKMHRLKTDYLSGMFQ